jgi:alpha-beta hydrolase superfamily lysophospholipase
VGVFLYLKPMKQILLLAVAFMASLIGSAQQNKNETEVVVNPLISGTLYSPEKTTRKPNLVILIAGSGLTDRNGNQQGVENNSLRLLAQGLAKDGNAVYSYDKRMFAQIKSKTADEKTLRFADFIDDAKDVIAYFRDKKQYAKIIVAGHSEGSLIGLMAAQEKRADGYISIAGPARPIDEIITDQITAQMPSMRDEINGYFDKMRKGESFDSNPMLQSVFRESVRPYMLSWMAYKPLAEIKKLNIPVLIINGTKDLQVKTTEAEALKAAKPDAKLVIIENMNHVFKEIKGDNTENMQSYNIPDLPVAPELVSAVNQFIKTL